MLRKLIISLILPLIAMGQAFALFGPSQNNEKKQRLELSNLLQYEKNTISVFDNVSDSVVNISNNRLVRSGWFFDAETIEVPAGAGSGFVWDDKGHIITNYHVVQNGSSFTVSFKNDSKQYEAVLVGTVSQKDIAVLKLKEMPKKLHPVTMGLSNNLQVGQKAMAIGNPFGLNQSISAGIISALDRKIRGIGDVKIYGMIQTDCSINPGNSGGPLIDSLGHVIGMNTMIYSNSGSSAGIGFAVPSNTISRIVPELIKHGKIISRPYIGVTLIQDSLARYFGIKKGIAIKEVLADGPSAKAGLKGTQVDRQGRPYFGDIIIGIDKHKIDNYDDIYHTLEKYKKGDKVTLKYRRGKKIRSAEITLN